MARVFDAKIVDRGGIVRRSAASVDREIGRAAFVQQVMVRGFHLVERGDQFVVICNRGLIKIIVCLKISGLKFSDRSRFQPPLIPHNSTCHGQA
jgi:hypothetical protein